MTLSIACLCFSKLPKTDQISCRFVSTVTLPSENSRNLISSVNTIRVQSATDQVLRCLHHRVRLSAVLGRMAIVFAADLPLMPYLCRARRIVFADTPFVVADAATYRLFNPSLSHISYHEKFRP